MDDPTQPDLVKLVLTGVKRILAHKATKEPLTPKILSQLVDRFAHERADLDDIRVMTVAYWFSGFLRYSELAALKESDVKIYMEIFIESSKTDQYRDGAWVIIALTAGEDYRTLLYPWGHQWLPRAPSIPWHHTFEEWS